MAAGLALAAIGSMTSAAADQVAAGTPSSVVSKKILPDTVVNFEKGREQFTRTCAQCHGRNMVSSGNTVYDLRKFPLDQADRFFTSVPNGKGNMPAFKEALTLDQIALVWVYVKNRGKSPE